MKRRRDERGAALLSVLLLVAVMAVIAATALDRLTLATRIAGSAATVDQGAPMPSPPNRSRCAASPTSWRVTRRS